MVHRANWDWYLNWCRWQAPSTDIISKVWGIILIQYKSNAIPGIYEQYEDAENGIYYRRTAFVRGRPDMAYFPKGEEDPDFVPRRPEYTYRTELIRNVDDFNTINQTSPEMNSFVNLILNQVQTVRFSTNLVHDESFVVNYDQFWPQSTPKWLTMVE